jgi:hypothetical protein
MKLGESVVSEKSIAFRHKMFLIVKPTYYWTFFVETNIQKDQSFNKIQKKFHSV